MTNCIFCQIIAGESPAHVISEDVDVIVLSSLESHPMIVPKLHVADIHGLDDALGSKIMSTTIRIANATKRALECDGIYLAQTNGVAAEQSVFHFHLHIYPRWLDKRRLATDHSSRAETAARIKAAL